MATVINNPSTSPVTERTVVERVDDSASAGWAVAVIVLIAVIAVGGYYLIRHYQTPAAAPATSNGGASIQVNLPAGSSDNSGSTDNTAPAQ